MVCVCSLQSAVCSLRSAVCKCHTPIVGQIIAQFTICNLWSASAVCCLQSAVCSLRSAVCSLRSAVCSLQMSYTDCRLDHCSCINLSRINHTLHFRKPKKKNTSKTITAQAYQSRCCFCRSSSVPESLETFQPSYASRKGK